MCGIVGFIHCGNPAQLDAATDAMQHRGPDDRGTQWFSDLNIGLGHRRLSIIDLSKAGHQPMTNTDLGLWIVFNGELFNYRELRQTLEQKAYTFRTSTDTEVVIAAFHYWGPECLNHFNGMFAFAILDQRSGKLFMARDRLGIKPLYYWLESGKLAFASEIKAILECRDYHKEPDLRALHTPAHYQIGPYTGFKGILKLEPGSHAVFQSGNFTITKYWRIEATEEETRWQDAAEELDALLLDSIRLQMISDVEVGSLLSGGLDSSLISVLMQKRMDRPLNTFTIRFKAEDLRKHGNVDDSSYARKLTEELGFRHHEITINPEIVTLLQKLIHHLEEPLADPAAINTYLISQEARDRGIFVLLSGIGADEVFGGYRSQLACLKAETYQQYLPRWTRQLIESGLGILPEGYVKPLRWARRFTEIASLPPFERYISASNTGLQENQYMQLFLNPVAYYDTYYIHKQKEFFESSSYLNYLTRICLNDSSFYLPDHNLTYTDKSAMAAGVETRPPLIDHRIVELMFRLKPEFRIQGNKQKALLKHVASAYLPEYIINRPKAPFSAPMRSWLRGDLKEMVAEILSERSIQQRGLYNPTTVAWILDQNSKGKRDFSQLIWRMMVNEIWFRTFFEK